MKLILEVSGAGLDRGRVLGAACKAEIALHLERLYASWARAGVEHPENYGREFLAQTTYAETVRRDAPELMDEVAGLASGAAIGFESAFLLQLMDEEWAHRQHRFNTDSREKCSSVAIRDEAAGVTYIGQNMDLGGYTDGLQTFIRHRPANDGPTQLVFSTAGVLALMGVNDAGVAVCVNALPQLPSRGAGMPVAFVIRLLLGADSAAEAAEILKSIMHATNQHYLIADASSMFSFEVSAREVVPSVPSVPDRVFHTNHPLTGIERAHARDETDSNVRLGCLTARLARGAPSLRVIQDALSSHDDPSHPVCRSQRDCLDSPTGITTGSLISVLEAEGGVQGVVSFGPPCNRGYQPWSMVSRGAGPSGQANGSPAE